jgi:NADH-quinone oxidoreductase subunit G
MSKIENSKNRTVTVTIDGQEFSTEYGKTILQVARENGIYIPTMCYLSKVEPIASCRMCVVEVEGVDGMILSCQEKAVDGAVINTNTKDLERERQSIMKLYDVNHPLECGVCDKSGECDLQNKTLEYNVSSQSFTTKEPARPVQNWGLIDYDPSLCIMCEKCVRVCNEIVGSEQLQISVGGYKSTIINTQPDSDCISCGECMSVCPVGALANHDFKYSANAWELNKIPSACALCSAGCEMVYETKPESIDNPQEKIYRVTNNFEFSSLCGAGRFGFDYENRDAYKDVAKLKSAVEAFKKADTVRFSSLITNEEALLLKRIAKSVGAKLVCDDAYGFSKFLSAYQRASGKTFWGATLEDVAKSDVVITLGSRIKDDAPMVKNHIAMAAKREKAKVIYMHPIEDSRIKNLVTRFVKYEPGSEEGVAAMLLDLLSRESQLPTELKSFVDELDIGYLSGESAVSEEELEAIHGDLWKRKRFTLIVGEDIFNHPEVENIASLVAAIEKYSNFKLLVVPPASNTLGVSLLCDLEKECSGYTVGYNAKGDFELSALGGADLDIPAMNQQEGTITTINKRVVALNAALGYEGYTLNDIANELGLGSRYTIDFTKELADENSAFVASDFDSLGVDFSITGEDIRGYALQESRQEGSLELKEPDDLPSFDGVVIYNVNPAHNPNPFTQKAKLTKSDAKLFGTQQFAAAAKLKEGDVVEFELDGNIVKRVFSIDTSLKGTIALNPTFDMGLSAFSVSSYRFSKININKVGSANE